MVPELVEPAEASDAALRPSRLLRRAPLWLSILLPKLQTLSSPGRHN